MASYWKHKRSRTREIPYEFICEHCGKSSGPLTAKIVEEVEHRSSFRTISEKKEQQLREQVDARMESTMKRIYKDATTEDEFSEEFKDVCPHCQKHQSWALKAMGQTPFIYGFVGLFVGGVIAVLAVDKFGAEIMHGVIGAVVAMLACFAVGKLRIAMRARQSEGVTPRKPEITWPDDVLAGVN